jgi:site-specific DNA-methyltransferase (cytosine-N4-specific)
MALIERLPFEDGPPAGPDVEVRTELSAIEREMLDRAGLGAPRVEVWTVAGSNRAVGYSTHSLFRYFGKFPPPIAGHLIRRHTATGDLVRDPTCGSGTTGVESLLHERRCELSDINPFCDLLARVKTRFVPEEQLQRAIDRVADIYKPMDSGDCDVEPIGLRNVDHWFLPESIRSLRGLRYAIDSEGSLPEREFLLAVFASCVRRVSRATTQQGRQFLDVATALEDAWPVFERGARRGASSVGALPPHAAVDVRQWDVLCAPPACEPAALTIVHPPYFNAYRYSSINSFEMAWLGFPPAGVRRREIREAFKTATREKVERYVEDMVSALSNVAATTRGGVLALMIGDTILRGEYLSVVRSIVEQLPKELCLDEVALRVPRHTEATWVASQRRTGREIGAKLYDFVLTFSVAA